MGRLGDTALLWELRKAWRDGTRAFVFEPLTFLERLVAIMPHPREHQLTYHGTLAPASPLRDEVVLRSPSARVDASCEEGADDCTRKTRMLWAELLERVFGVDILRCPRCGGRRHMIAQITDPFAIRKVLGHLDLRTEPLELADGTSKGALRRGRSGGLTWAHHVRRVTAAD